MNAQKNEVLAAMLVPLGLVDVTEEHVGRGYWFRFATNPRIKFEILPTYPAKALFTMCLDGALAARREIIGDGKTQMSAEEIVSVMQDIVEEHSGDQRLAVA